MSSQYGRGGEGGTDVGAAEDAAHGAEACAVEGEAHVRDERRGPAARTALGQRERAPPPSLLLPLPMSLLYTHSVDRSRSESADTISERTRITLSVKTDVCPIGRTSLPRAVRICTWEGGGRGGTVGHRCRRIRPGRSARPTCGAGAASRLCRFSSGLERMYVKIRGPDVKMRGTAGGCRGEWSSRKKDAVVDNRARRLQEEVERGVRHADLRARAAHVTRPAPTRERAPTPHLPY